ncbi:hypothetical protein [Streptomyces sp. NRRL B-24484]|uniref:hypothetical protein n=1 Tax=Streptomyces sp. NRRL B-24484 TaxID=1463833 RepID=UPI000694CF63|nr:hypothetical protein [Streptomyces sp. NRRL B-24484]
MNLQWILLASATVLFLPPGVALAAGWAPRRLRPRLEPVRARGWCLLACYLTAPLNAIPRASGAAPGIVLLCTAAAVPCMLAGLIGLFVADSRRKKNLGGADPQPAAR